MHRFVGTILGLAIMGGVANAQTADPGKGYVEVVAQSAFGNVTSQNYGVEAGYTVYPNVQVFGEFGRTRNIATSEFSAGAQTIATALTVAQTQPVSFTAKQPLTFGLAGAKYLVPIEGSKILPYVMAGIGAARITSDARFVVAGTDVTSNIAQYGIVLGTDLQGSVTKAMISLGGGATYPIYQQVVLDLQFRYGHVFASGESINVTRAGIGLGIRF